MGDNLPARIGNQHEITSVVLPPPPILKKLIVVEPNPAATNSPFI